MDDKYWKAGAKTINEKIADLVIAHEVRESRKLTQLTLTDANRFEEVDGTGEREKDFASYFEEAKTRMDEALGDFKNALAGNHNALGVFSGLIEEIRARLERAHDRPVRFYEYLESEKSRLLERAGYAGLDDDADVKVLAREFERSLRDLWNTNPDIRKRDEERKFAGFERLTDEEKAQFSEIYEALGAQSTPKLKEEIAEDGIEIANPDLERTQKKRPVSRATDRIGQAVELVKRVIDKRKLGDFGKMIAVGVAGNVVSQWILRIILGE